MTPWGHRSARAQRRLAQVLSVRAGGLAERHGVAGDLLHEPQAVAQLLVQEATQVQVGESQGPAGQVEVLVEVPGTEQDVAVSAVAVAGGGYLEPSGHHHQRRSRGKVPLSEEELARGLRGDVPRLPLERLQGRQVPVPAGTGGCRVRSRSPSRRRGGRRRDVAPADGTGRVSKRKPATAASPYLPYAL